MTDEQEHIEPIADQTPSQAELYADLQRIGELEDDKANIQSEIDSLTARLTNAVPHLDKSSLLHQMLSATMKPKSAAPKRTTSKRTAKAAKKSPRKK